MYRRKYVAFIDLFGFSSLVQASAEKTRPPHEVYGVLDLFQNSVQTAVDGGLRASQFSDCLVLSADADPDGLLNLFSAVKTIADNLLQIDMLVRGAVTVGPFVHDDNVVFGPPLIEAYRMESQTVSLPMVQLSDAVMRGVDDLPGDLGQVIVFRFRERPASFYLHTLIDWTFFDGVPRPGLVVLDEPSRLVRHHIARRLAEHKGSLREKADWMRRYWNEAVAAGGYFPKVDETLDLPYPVGCRPFQKRIVQVAKSALGPRSSVQAISEDLDGSA